MARTANARGLRDEDGISLIEVLVTATLMLVVLGALLSLSETSAKLAPRESERATVIAEAQAGLHRMTRELRQARDYDETASGPYVVAAAQVANGGTSITVTYRCDAPHPTNGAWTQCTRTESGRTTVVIDRVLSARTGRPVFTYDGAYVDVRVQVPQAGERTDGHSASLYLDDGVFMRNHR